MSASRSDYRGPAYFRRRAPTKRPSGHCFLIVTEGEKTEPNYFRALARRFGLTAIDVEVVHPEATDPNRLLTAAVTLQKRRKKDVKRGLKIDYDEVWILCDLEESNNSRRGQAKTAIDAARRKGVKVATSDPCFEFWYLLHETYTTKPFQDCDEVIEDFKRLCPRYEKGAAPPAAFIEKLPTAVRNARKVREYHASGDGNPSTFVDELAMSLNEARPKHRQMNLD